MFDFYFGYFLLNMEVFIEEEVLIVLFVLGGYDLDNMDGKLFIMESVVEIFCKDGSVLVSFEEEIILNLKEIYVNLVGLLGKYVLKVYNGDILFFRFIVILDWFDFIFLNMWLNYLDG